MPAYLGVSSTDATVRLPVLASAGADAEVLRGYTAHLDGRGSYHPGGREFSVLWTQTAGETVHLSNVAGLAPSFLAPLAEQTLVFEIRADDGRSTTTDTVAIHISTNPNRRAPTVHAGPDRRLLYGQPAEPQSEDEPHSVSADTIPQWELIEAKPSPDSAGPGTSTSEGEPLSPRIFRLTAVRNNLRSCPDYLILHPFDSEQRGARAPTVNVTGPEVAEPGTIISYDTAASSDVNGDAISFRWEVIRGGARDAFGRGTLNAPAEGSGARGQPKLWSVTAPNRAQELAFRIFASDGVLESAPADISTLIAGPVLVDLDVLPTLDQRVHGGNSVLLNARSQFEPGADDVGYRWVQTYGEEVRTEQSEDGRLLRFEAPAEPLELAFAVSAFTALPDETSVPDDAPPPEERWLEGEASVARVTIIPDSENNPPRIAMCASTLTPEAGQRVILVARAADPEGDTLHSPEWNTLGATYGGAQLFSYDQSQLPGLCGETPSASGQDDATLFTVSLVIPDTGEFLTVQTEVCDSLGACAMGSVDLTILP